MTQLMPKSKGKIGFIYVFSKQKKKLFSKTRYFYRKKVTIVTFAVIIATAIYLFAGVKQPMFIWENEAVLTSEGSIILQWNTDDQYIIMKITGRTKGYLGIALSFSDDMTDADVVIGWVKEGVPYIEDRYAVHNGHTNLDKIQNYELISGHENGTHTIILFRRKLITCDDMDLNITDSTTRIWWTIGNNDLDDSNHKDIQFYQPTSGSIYYNFGYLWFKKPIGDDITNYDITFDKIAVNQGYYETLYWCKFFRLPNLSQKHHIAGYEILSDKTFNKVHHIVAFTCPSLEKIKVVDSDRGHKCYLGPTMNLDWMCHKQMLVFSLPLKPRYYPEHTGYPFGGMTVDESMYLLLQFHYNNIVIPEGGLEVNDGLRLLITKKVRPNDASAFLIGIKNYQMIPPNQKGFRNVGICSASCTKKHFPEEGIRLFRLILHAHLTTKTIILHHYRNGIEIESMEDTNFKFIHQPARNLKKEIVVLPNDSLAVECISDTPGKNKTVIGGFESDAEMCVVFIEYYPAIDIGRCWSVADELTKLASIPDIKWDIPNIPKPLKEFLGFYYFLYVEWRLKNNVNWSSKAEQLQNTYLTGNHKPYCSDSKHSLDDWPGDYVNFSDFIPLQKNMVCSRTQ